MAWVLIPMQVNHRNQINDRFPNRSKQSDGSIGDFAHQQEKSGHNPDDTIYGNAEYEDHDGIQEVRAIDVDKDLNDATADMEDVIQHYVRMGRDGRWLPFRYFIFKRRIWRKSSGWVTETYTGPNPHDEHAHFSGDYSQAADNASTYDFKLWEVGMTAMDLTPEAVQAIATKISADLNNATSGIALGTIARNRDAMNQFWGDAYHAARSLPGAAPNTGDQVYQDADSVTQQRMRYPRDIVQGVVGGPVSAQAIIDGVNAGELDPQEIITGVLAGLNPAQIAAMVAAALPADQAQRTADEIAARLAA